MSLRFHFIRLLFVAILLLLLLVKLLIGLVQNIRFLNLLFCLISMTRVFDIQDLDRMEFFTMLCSNSKGALVQFRANIRDGKDILSISIHKAEAVDLGTVSSEFAQFIHYLCAYTYTGSYSVADLNETASDSIF